MLKEINESKQIPDQVLLWAIASEFQEVRITASYYISPESSDSVVSAALNSPHAEDFKRSWEGYFSV